MGRRSRGNAPGKASSPPRKEVGSIKPAKAQAKAPTLPTAPAKAPRRFSAPQEREDKPDPRSDGARYFSVKYEPVNDGDPLRDRVRGSFLWSVYGDACGMPFEGQAPFAIYKRNGNDWVKGLRTPRNNFARYMGRGGWTDDTQLKLAIMQAIIDNHGDVDMPSVADHHVRMYREGPRGWGGSTRESVQRLMRRTSWRRSGKPGGAGNGVCMKIAPIGWMYGIKYATALKDGTFRYKDLATDARDIACMTHRDSRAVISGIVQSVLVAWAMNDVDPLANWDRLMKLVRTLEDLFPDEYDLLSERFEHIPGNLDKGAEYFAHLYRTGCFVVESYPFSVATYLIYRKDVLGGVLAAVNAGGDCDSTAAIVGDLCGAEAGLGTEDKTLDLECHDLLLGTVDAFFDTVRSSTN